MSAVEEVADAEVVPEPGQGLVRAVPSKLAVTPEIGAAELVERLAVIQSAMTTAMTEGVDYGTIPGTGSKPTLLKPGAEKLGVLFQLDVQIENEKVYNDDHLTVTSRATAFHAPTGTRVGYGEGICTTRERKYAYRKGERVCPDCAKPAVIKGKAEYGGGWLCFNKKGGCGTKWADDTDQAQAFASQDVGEIENPDLPDLWNCVTPETRILTRDLRWVPAGDIQTGDVLVGVAEEDPWYGRTYEDAVATVGARFTDDIYEVELVDGRVVRCNGEHRWLVKALGEGAGWVPTIAMYEATTTTRTGRPRNWRIYGIGTPWEHEASSLSRTPSRFEGNLSAVAEIRALGRGELVRLGTSSRTYIAEGLVCHNTVVKMAEKRARVDVILAVTGASALFTQDIEDQAVAAVEAQTTTAPPFGTATGDGLLKQTYAAIAYILGRSGPTDHSVVSAVARMTVSLEKTGFGDAVFYFPFASAVGICAVATELKEIREGAAAKPGSDSPDGETNEERAERVIAEGARA